MPRALILHPQARIDLARNAASIVRTVSDASAVRWRNRIERVIQALVRDAEVWPEAEEAATLGRDLRFRLFGKQRHVYRILYTYDEATVTIQRVMHASQDWLTELD